jgi:hypothetical protein
VIFSHHISLHSIKLDADEVSGITGLLNDSQCTSEESWYVLQPITVQKSCDLTLCWRVEGKTVKRHQLRRVLAKVKKLSNI